MPERVTVKGEGLSVELLLHRRYGVRGRSLLEDTLRLNVGVSDMGAFLPLGTVVILPDIPVGGVSPRKLVTLFPERES